MQAVRAISHYTLPNKAREKISSLLWDDSEKLKIDNGRKQVIIVAQSYLL